MPSVMIQDRDQRRGVRGDGPALPVGSVGYEAEANERGERLVWLEDAMADLLFPPSATVLCSARRG
jgi:hypothetical protein